MAEASYRHIALCPVDPAATVPNGFELVGAAGAPPQAAGAVQHWCAVSAASAVGPVPLLLGFLAQFAAWLVPRLGVPFFASGSPGPAEKARVGWQLPASALALEAG